MWPGKFGCEGRASGFTLIELLVVIAIITLLASILMPTLQKAQEFANRAKCAGQFRAHDTGYRLYAQDWDDYIVSTMTFKNVNGVVDANVQRSLLLDCIFGKGASLYIKTNSTANNALDKDRNNAIFLCPTAVKRRSLVGAEWVSMVPTRVFSTNTCGASVAPRKYTDYVWPGEIAAECDSSQSYGNVFDILPVWYCQSIGRTNYSPVSYRHIGNSMNLLFVDGHVKAILDTEGVTANSKSVFVARVGPQ